MFKYLLYKLRNNIIFFLILVLAYGFEGYLVINGMLDSESEKYAQTNFKMFGYVTIYITIAVICAIIIKEYSGFMNKRNLDSWFSFAISRKQLYIAGYIDGIIKFTGAYALNLITLAVCGLIMTAKGFDSEAIGLTGKALLYLLIIYLWSCILIAAGASFYVRENTKLLAEFTMVMYAFFPSLLIHTVDEFLIRLTEWKVSVPSFGGSGYSVLSPLGYAANVFGDICDGESGLPKFGVNATKEEYIVFLILLAAVGLYTIINAFIGPMIFNKRNAYNMGSISTGYFGYRTMVTITMSLFMLQAGYAASRIMYLILAVIAIIIGERKITKKGIRSFVIIFIFMIIGIVLTGIYEYNS